MNRDYGRVVSFRAPRRLLDQLAGPQRGAASRLMRRLLAEEAQRRGIAVAPEARRRPTSRSPKTAA